MSNGISLTEPNYNSLNEKNKNIKTESILIGTNSKVSNPIPTNKYKFSYSNIKNNESKNNNILIINNSKENKSNNIKNNHFESNKRNSNKMIDNNNNLSNHLLKKKTKLKNNDIDTKDNHKYKNIVNISISNNNNTNRKILSSGNLQSPSKFKNKCEIIYSKNKTSNVKYVNGNDKNISEIFSTRNPDIKFTTHQSSEKKIKSIHRKNNMGDEMEEKNIYDKNSNFIKENGKIINKKNNLTNISKNIRRKNYAKRIKTNNIETYQVNFSDGENSETKSITNKNAIRFFSPEPNRKNKRYVNINNRSNNYFNTYDELEKRQFENINIKARNNISQVKICSVQRNNKSFIKNNHNFKSINESKSLNRSNHSAQRNDLNKSNESKRKYKYDIKIQNINVRKGMNRSVSYESYRNNKTGTSIQYSTTEQRNHRNNSEENNSYDNKKLKMQNAQNMQVIQEEKLFQVLVPIPPNKIEYSCDLQISGSGKKKYSIEEIEEIMKKRNIQKTKIEETIEENNIKEKRKQNRKENNNYLERKYITKKPNWNKTNEAIKENKLSYDFNKKIKDRKEIQKNEIIQKKDEKKNEFGVENFEINILDNGRKFKGKMTIENNSVEYEKEEKNSNSNLLLTENEQILLKADYPKRDWNKITRPISGRPLSIEKKLKPLLERRVNQLNINGKKKRQNLSKERFESINIKGNPKDWRNIIQRECESDFTIKGKENQNIENYENDEEILINDDYNIIQKTNFAQARARISKVKEISEESSSEYDVLKRINGHPDDNRALIKESAKQVYERKVKINKISGRYPNGIETLREKIDNEITSDIIQTTNIQNNIRNLNNFYTQDLNNYTMNSNTNQNEVEQYPKYIYREKIHIKLKTDVDNVNNPESNNLQNGNECQNFSFKTPKREAKYTYREEILTLSPKSSSKREVNSHNVSNENIINNKYFENQYEIKSNSIRSSDYTEINSNNIQNNNQENNNTPLNIDNINPIIDNILDEQYYPEQEIPKISDEDQNNSNNYNYFQNQEQNSENPQKIQYVYIQGNSKKNNNNSINDKKDFKKVIISNQYNENINEEENHEKNSGFLKNRNNYGFMNQYNINQSSKIINSISLPSQNKMNFIEAQYKDKNGAQNKELINEGFEKKNEFEPLENININKSEIINLDHLNKIKYLNNLNSQQKQLDQIEISKSQVISPSPTENQNQNKMKYENFIKNYSNHLMTNPSDNFNNFSINKLNLIPSTSNKKGNIIFNNTLTILKKTNNFNNPIEKDLQNNEIYDKNKILNNNINNYNFGEDKQLNYISKAKVKILKP